MFVLLNVTGNAVGDQYLANTITNNVANTNINISNIKGKVFTINNTGLLANNANFNIGNKCLTFNVGNKANTSVININGTKSSSVNFNTINSSGKITVNNAQTINIGDSNNENSQNVTIKDLNVNNTNVNASKKRYVLNSKLHSNTNSSAELNIANNTTFNNSTSKLEGVDTANVNIGSNAIVNNLNNAALNIKLAANEVNNLTINQNAVINNISNESPTITLANAKTNNIVIKNGVKFNNGNNAQSQVAIASTNVNSINNITINGSLHENNNLSFEASKQNTLNLNGKNDNFKFSKRDGNLIKLANNGSNIINLSTVKYKLFDIDGISNSENINTNNSGNILLGESSNNTVNIYGGGNFIFKQMYIVGNNVILNITDTNIASSIEAIKLGNNREDGKLTNSITVNINSKNNQVDFGLANIEAKNGLVANSKNATLNANYTEYNIKNKLYKNGDNYFAQDINISGTIQGFNNINLGLSNLNIYNFVQNPNNTLNLSTYVYMPENNNFNDLQNGVINISNTADFNNNKINLTIYGLANHSADFVADDRTQLVKNLYIFKLQENAQIKGLKKNDIDLNSLIFKVSNVNIDNKGVHVDVNKCGTFKGVLDKNGIDLCKGDPDPDPDPTPDNRLKTSDPNVLSIAEELDKIMASKTVIKGDDIKDIIERVSTTKNVAGVIDFFTMLEPVNNQILINLSNNSMDNFVNTINEQTLKQTSTVSTINYANPEITVPEDDENYVDTNTYIDEGESQEQVHTPDTLIKYYNGNDYNKEDTILQDKVVTITNKYKIDNTAAKQQEKQRLVELRKQDQVRKQQLYARNQALHSINLKLQTWVTGNYNNLTMKDKNYIDGVNSSGGYVAGEIFKEFSNNVLGVAANYDSLQFNANNERVENAKRFNGTSQIINVGLYHQYSFRNSIYLQSIASYEMSKFNLTRNISSNTFNVDYKAKSTPTVNGILGDVTLYYKTKYNINYNLDAFSYNNQSALIINNQRVKALIVDFLAYSGVNYKYFNSNNYQETGQYGALSVEGSNGAIAGIKFGTTVSTTFNLTTVQTITPNIGLEVNYSNYSIANTNASFLGVSNLSNHNITNISPNYSGVGVTAKAGVSYSFNNKLIGSLYAADYITNSINSFNVGVTVKYKL